MFEYDARSTIAVGRCQALVRSTLTASQLRTAWEGLGKGLSCRWRKQKVGKHFGLGLRICSGLAPAARLEGMCTCRSHDHAGLGHAWSLLKEHSWGCLAEHQLCCPCVSLALHPPLAVAALALLAQCSRASATASRFWWLRAEHLWQSLMLGACTEMEVSEWSLPAWSDAVANRVCFGTCFVMEGCRRLMQWSW